MLVLLVGSMLVVGAVMTNSTNETINQTSTINITLPVNETSVDIGILAKIYNQGNLDFDREYRLRYLQNNNNFSDIVFKNLTSDERFTLKVGSRNDNIKGFNVNN